MAGGGLVTIGGANSRKEGQAANVQNNALCVHLAGSSGVVQVEVTNPVLQVEVTNVPTCLPLSESSDGGTITVLASTTLHSVPADVTDKLTLYASNQSTAEAVLQIGIGAGAVIIAHIPPQDTRIVLDHHVVVGAVTIAAVSSLSVEIFGDVERQP